MTEADRRFHEAVRADDGPCSAGWPGPRPPLTDADLRRLEEAWSAPSVRDAVADDGPCSAGWPGPRPPLTDAELRAFEAARGAHARRLYEAVVADEGRVSAGRPPPDHPTAPLMPTYPEARSTS